MAEVLAALLFMTIVIPVAIGGLRVANSAGVVADRKREATDLAERILQESLVTGQWQSGITGGTWERNGMMYRYDLYVQPWIDVNRTMQLVTVQVIYPVQGRDYEVALSTLMPTPTL